MQSLALCIATAAFLFAGPACGQTATTALGDPHFAAMLERSGDIEGLRSEAAAQRARLESLSRERDPNAWADNQEALGDILLAIALGELAASARTAATPTFPSAAEAETVLRAALDLRSQQTEPARWARLQVKLAMAMIWQPGRHPHREVMECFRAALPAFRRTGARLEWSTVQATIAFLARNAVREDETLLPDGIAAAGAAAQEYDSLHMSAEAAASRAMADELRRMQSDIEGLRARVGAFTAGNSPSAQEGGREQGAMASLVFAETLLNQAESSAGFGVGRYGYTWREAESLVRGALTALSRESQPQQWARAQHDLGRALQGRGRDAGRRQAVLAYTAALSVRSQQRGSEDWTRSQGNLMRVLDEISRYDESIAPEALAAAHEMLEHFSGGRMGDYFDALSIVERLEGSERADEYLERLDNR